ncbi:MAG: pilus assembly protein [Sedimentisphaerales bacterium]|nr:pilus assembly protein [Sedimentisphaerales bacterium]
MNIKLIKQTWKKGAAAVEAAILFPLLLLLTFAIIEYGWLFLNANLVTNAARHGARIAVLPNSTSTDVTSAISDLMSTANITGYSVTITPSDLASLTVGQIVTVQITVPWQQIAIINSPFLPMPTTDLQASVSMAKEGP